MVLLAVVLVVALISVALLNFFPGMSTDAQLAQSQAYWSGTARPIGVTEATSAYGTICGSSGSGGYTLVLQNTEASSITVNGISIDGSTGFCGPAGTLNAPVSLGAGERKVFSVITSASSSPCTEGKVAQVGLNFTYSTPVLANRAQYGSKKLAVRCSTPAAASCTADGQTCDGLSQCCSGLVCSDDSGYCQSGCLDDGQAFCSSNSDCCSGLCTDGTCGGAIRCQSSGQVCVPLRAPFCCAGLNCIFGHGAWTCQ